MPILISIPPKDAVLQVVGYIKGIQRVPGVIHMAQTYMGCQRNFTGEHFGARGCYVSPLGINEEALR